MQTIRRLEESERRFRTLAESTDILIALSDEEGHATYFNKAREDFTGRSQEALHDYGCADLVHEEDRKVFLELYQRAREKRNLYADVLPELDNQQIYPQLDRVYTTGVPFHARDQRVDLVVNGMLQPFYFNYSFTPPYNMEGEIYGVMNTAADLTSLHLAKQRVEQSEKNLRNMVLQAPVAMCILAGPNHVVEVVNDLMIALWGKPRESVMNKPIFEGLPHARDQGLEPVMANVYHTGETFTASERPVNLLRNGKLEAVYQNFVYEPYRDSDGTILGVLPLLSTLPSRCWRGRRLKRLLHRAHTS